MTNKIPNIVIVLPDLQGGGIERVMLNLASGFLQKNCTVHIIVFRNFIELAIPPQVTIHHFKNYHRWLPRKIRTQIIAPVLDKFIIKNCGAPDLILSNQLFAHIILSASRFNVYFMVHNNIGSARNRDLKIYQKKPTICVSKGVMDNFIKGIKPKKMVKTIYNPVDTKLIEKNATDKNPLDTKDYIIQVGRFALQKRYDVLIRAYHKSGVKNPLVLVGQGKLEAELKELVADLDLEKQVIFAGFHSNPYPLIKDAKLMVLSSDHEGLGMVILEAITLNVPVISTDCPSGPSEILPSKNLCPVGDIDKLAELIKKATDNPTQYQHSLHEKFTLNYATKEYLNL